MKLKSIFITIGVIGFMLIVYCAFNIPDNPYEIIPAMTMVSFDKPLWLCYIVGGGFIYLGILLYIYDKLTGEITKWCNEN